MSVTAPSPRPGTTPPSTSRPRTPAGSIAAAVAVNLAVHLVARASGASMTVDPAIGRPGHRIRPGAVAAKTVVPLAASAAALGSIGRRSGAALATTTLVGTGLIALSISAVSHRARDRRTALACSTMHGVVGLTYVRLGLLARPGAD